MINEKKDNSMLFLSEEDIKKNEVTDFSIFLRELDPDTNYFTAPITDEETNKKLEQAYSDHSLNNTGVIDTENFPQDIPDKATCKILDDLDSKNQLSFRQVKYCIGNLVNPIHMTDYFNECSYNGRRFVKYQSIVDAPSITLLNNDIINRNKFYWFEVKPTNLENGKILYSEFDSTETEKGRKV